MEWLIAAPFAKKGRRGKSSFITNFVVKKTQEGSQKIGSYYFCKFSFERIRVDRKILDLFNKIKQRKVC